jgi:hypothetical protein
VSPTDVSILELSTGFRYNSAVGVAPNFGYGTPHEADRYGTRAAMSYVTGSHAFKVGLMFEGGFSKIYTENNGNVDYQFLRGVPVAIDEYATPYLELGKVKADLGLYAQDQWTLKRLTVNAGLRFEYFNGWVPAQSQPAVEFAPARQFAAVYDVPDWKDLSPRLGASYDLFGNGRTAIKATFGRYVGPHGIDITTLNNPLVTTVDYGELHGQQRRDRALPGPEPLGLRNPDDCDMHGNGDGSADSAGDRLRRPAQPTRSPPHQKIQTRRPGSRAGQR